MSRTIPEEIVAGVQALAEELAAWCAEGREAPLAAHEQAVLERVRRALPRLLRAVVITSTSGLDRRLVRARAGCPGCGRKVAPRDRRVRQVLTRCGTLDLERPWYHGAGCGQGWSALETILAVEPRARLSGGLAEWLARLGAAAPFREAAELLAELTGLELGSETLRRHTERVGAELEATQQAAFARVAATREAAEPLAPAPGLLVVETDGALVRYRDGWHEVKLGLVAGLVDGEQVAPSYVAAREPAEVFGSRLLAEAARRGVLEIERWEGGVTGRGVAMLRTAAVLGDGAVWIWNQADEQLDGRVEIVDYFHAAEHLGTLAKALHGDGPVAEAWLAARQGELLAQGAEAVLAALRGARGLTPEAATVLRTERGYFSKNAERMQYPLFRLDGLPIGSGAIESAADHLVQRRMQRAGMRWSVLGGQALLTLRAHLRSGRPLAGRPARVTAPRATPIRAA